MKNILFLALVVCALAADPDVVVVKSTGLYPEGVEYDSSTGFLISSLTQGKVSKVDDNGVRTDFVTSLDLVASVGLQVDKGRNQLYICNGNLAAFSGATTGFLSGLVVASLTTGEVIRSVDLSAIAPVANKTHLVNDATFDDDGNIYLTDSYGSQIWKVTQAGVGSTWVTDARFTGDPLVANGIGLNGIEYKDGYILAGKSGPGKIFKIPIANPSSVTEVTITGSIQGLDGMTFDTAKEILHIGSDGAVYQVESTDDWETAKVTNTFTSAYSGGTTLANRGSEVYLMHSHISTFGVSDQTDFEIEKVVFGEVNGVSQLVASLLITICCLLALL